MTNTELLDRVMLRLDRQFNIGAQLWKQLLLGAAKTRGISPDDFLSAIAEEVMRPDSTQPFCTEETCATCGRRQPHTKQVP